jgi:hypothetical protein
MTRTIIKTLIAASALVLVGAGCMDRLKPRQEAPVTEMRKTIQEAFKSTTSTFGAPTSTPVTEAPSQISPPEKPERWDISEVPAAKTTFVPPAGYWVFHSNERAQFYLVPGTPPAPGSPDPSENAINTSVATFNFVSRDPESFPTWERYELTMGQFACSDGNSKETLIVCTDKTSNDMVGKTNSGLPFHEFTIPAAKKIDNSPQGTRTFIMVRFGASSDKGLFVNVTKAAPGSAPALEFVKSIKVK